MLAAAATAAAVEVILAAPKKVPKEEKLFVEKPGFGKVRQQQLMMQLYPVLLGLQPTAEHARPRC